MKTKSLLLGSAAALVAVSGARAADAVIIPEPEAVEYVRVCDMYGSGYFYIPGTETCLKIGGYARYQVGGYSLDYDGETYGQAGSYGRAYLSASAKSETEYGTLTAAWGLYWTRSSSWETDYADVITDMDGAGSQSTGTTLDYAYIELGGLRAGYFAHWLDDGIAGETDSVPGLSSKFTSVRYTADMGTFSAGVSVDEIDGDGLWISDSFGWGGGASAGLELGVSGMVQANFGAASLRLVGFYDVDAENGGFEVNGSADVGPGTLAAYYLWSSGESEYVGDFNAPGEPWLDLEWSAGVSYAVAVNDKLSITPGFNYATFEEDDDLWRAGVTVDYEIVSGLDAKLSLQYEDFNDDWNGAGSDDYTAWEWFARFTRSF